MDSGERRAVEEEGVETRRVRISLRPHRLEDTAVAARKAEEKKKGWRRSRLFYWVGLKSILGADCL